MMKRSCGSEMVVRLQARCVDLFGCTSRVAFARLGVLAHVHENARNFAARHVAMVRSFASPTQADFNVYLRRRRLCMSSSSAIGS